MKEKYLPIGSVCLLKGATKEVMVMGYLPIANEDKSVMYDYSGCMYPEGMLNSNETIVFNHDQISEIKYMGYESEAGTQFINKVKNAVANATNLPPLANTQEEAQVAEAPAVDAPIPGIDVPIADTPVAPEVAVPDAVVPVAEPVVAIEPAVEVTELPVAMPSDMTMTPEAPAIPVIDPEAQAVAIPVIDPYAQAAAVPIIDPTQPVVEPMVQPVQPVVPAVSPVDPYGVQPVAPVPVDPYGVQPVVPNNGIVSGIPENNNPVPFINPFDNNVQG